MPPGSAAELAALGNNTEPNWFVQQQTDKTQDAETSTAGIGCGVVQGCLGRARVGGPAREASALVLTARMGSITSKRQV